MLKYLGYDIKLCGADMENPDVHIVSMVKVEGREFIVDVGYGAPFIEPLPRDLKENYVISTGNESYVLHPRDNSGNSKLEHYTNGELKHGYIAKPKSCEFGKFRNVIEESYRDDATFMNCVMIAKFHKNSSLALRNLDLIISGKNKVTKQSIRRDEIAVVAEKYFGIPRQTVDDAVNELLILKDTSD